MIYAAFVTEWDGSLSGTAFRFPDQETAVDARTEQVFSCIAGDGPMVPRMFLQRIDGRHIVGRNPADSTRTRMSFTPFSTFIIAQNFHLFTYKGFLTEKEPGLGLYIYIGLFKKWEEI